MRIVPVVIDIVQEVDRRGVLTAIVRQAHAPEPRGGHDAAARGAATLIGRADEGERRCSQVIAIGFLRSNGL
jgi:hypothetical protein